MRGKRGITPVISIVLLLMLTIALTGAAYMYISGMFQTKTQGIDVIDSFCNGGSASWIVRNLGSTDISASSVTILSVDESCTTDPVAVALPAGQQVTLTASCSTGRAHTFRLIGPSNVQQLMVICT